MKTPSTAAVTVIVTLTLGHAMATSAHAQQASQAEGEAGGTVGIDVEWDPSVLLLKGFSAVLAVGPGALPRWRFGLDVFTFAYPTSQLEEGWEARAYGASAMARFHPWGSPRGLWLSANVRVGRWRYARTPEGGSDSVLAMSVQARVGYNWFPFGKGFYVNPQIGIAVPLPVADAPEVDGVAHGRLPPFPVPALHVGYSF